MGLLNPNIAETAFVFWNINVSIISLSHELVSSGCVFLFPRDQLLGERC